MQDTPVRAAPEITGMTEVTREQFFDYVMNATHNILTNQSNPNYTVWETSGRVPIGRSYPGWKHPGDPERHYLRDDIAGRHAP